MVGVYIDGGDERGGGSLVGSIVSEYCADASTFERVFSSLDGRVFRRKPSESQGVFDVFLGDESAFHSARAVVRQLERFRRQFRAYSGFLVFSFVFVLDLDSGEESGGARREDDGDLYREASKESPTTLFPFFPFTIPLATDVPRERFLLLLLSSSRRRSSAMTVGVVGVSSASSSSQAASAHDDEKLVGESPFYTKSVVVFSSEYISRCVWFSARSFQRWWQRERDECRACARRVSLSLSLSLSKVQYNRIDSKDF